MRLRSKGRLRRPTLALLVLILISCGAPPNAVKTTPDAEKQTSESAKAPTAESTTPKENAVRSDAASTKEPVKTADADPVSAAELAANEKVRAQIERFKGRGAVGDQSTKPLDPKAELASFKIDEDFTVDLIESEPNVRQPLSINFDERGRMWVVQYIQYPFPAGLKVVSYDEHLRAVFDKVPDPPPKGTKGRDKITIHEDADGDGVFEKEKTFVDGLNIATSVERGRGGVWVMNPPYLLFYPDKNNDDVPDGDPEVHLSGFGLEDTHAVANSLVWGPDGWLYGGQGSTCTANVSSAVTKNLKFLGQAIWRYHPETKVFELVAEGGGNTFCVEFDAKGRCYSGHNGGNTRGFHFTPGGYHQKSWGKHGPLTDPYAFGFFPDMPANPSERFSHTFVVYEGAALPEKYTGHLFAPVPLHNYIALSERISNGSTFATKDIGKPLSTKDHWFRPVDIKAGPDGALYLADWYDTRLTHVDPRDTWDRSNGRIFRMKAKDAKPIAPFDYTKKSGDELIALLAHPNKWHRQMAQRLIADRKDAELVPKLQKLIDENDGQLALEALWAIHNSGGFNQASEVRWLGHKDPFVRLWTVRLIGDAGGVHRSVNAKLSELAEKETNIEVRAQLASTAKKLPLVAALPMVQALLARDEDASDPRIPVILWWAIVEKIKQHRAETLSWLQQPELWKLPIFRKAIASRLGQRFTTERSEENYEICAQLLSLAPDKETVEQVAKGMEEGLTGNVVQSVPSSLQTKFAELWDAGEPSMTLIRLGVRLGNAKATKHAVDMVVNEKTPAAQRLALVDLFAERREPTVVPALLTLLGPKNPSNLRLTALNALRRYQDPKIPAALLEMMPTMNSAMIDAAQSILASRKEWGRQLLHAVDQGKLKRDQVVVAALMMIVQANDAESDALIKKHWGNLQPSNEEKQARIAAVQKLATGAKGDLAKGRELFKNSCGKCHILFGEGGKVGPDLTGYERTNLGFLTPAIVDPSLFIREEFANFNIATVDGQVMTGVVVENTPQHVAIVNQEGQRVVVAREDIDSMAASRVSLMPDGLLDKLTDDDIKNLFAYLQSKAPVTTANK